MGKLLELRRQAEAAEALEKEGLAPKKASRSKAKAEKEESGEKKKKAVRKTREKPREKRRAIWVIYSGTMREEGRYPYWEKKAAEERLEMLRSRGKRLYFMQMVKELIVGDGEVQTIVPVLEDDEEVAAVAPAAAVAADEEGLSIEVDDADFSDAESEEEEEKEEAAEEE